MLRMTFGMIPINQYNINKLLINSIERKKSLMILSLLYNEQLIKFKKY